MPIPKPNPPICQKEVLTQQRLKHATHGIEATLYEMSERSSNTTKIETGQTKQLITKILKSERSSNTTKIET